MPVEPGEFPNGPCRKGRVYVMDDKDVVVMSKETWLNHGTSFETLRVIARKQTKKVMELTSQLAVEQLRLKDVTDRLENLRAVRRAEKRVDLEKEMKS